MEGQQQRDIPGGQQQQQKDIVRDLVKALETSQGVKLAMGSQVKNLKAGLLGGLNRVMNNKQGGTENMYQWEEVQEGKGRGFKRMKSSSLSPPTEKKKVRSLLGDRRVEV